jgi:hypothetical protein
VNGAAIGDLDEALAILVVQRALGVQGRSKIVLGDELRRARVSMIFGVSRE